MKISLRKSVQWKDQFGELKRKKCMYQSCDGPEPEENERTKRTGEDEKFSGIGRALEPKMLVPGRMLA